MRPHPRIRKTVKWGGLVLCVLIATLWVWSGWYGIFLLDRGTWGVACNCGVIGILQNDSGSIASYSSNPVRRMASAATGSAGGPMAPAPFSLIWKFGWASGPSSPGARNGWWILDIPIWCPAIVALGLTVRAWMLDAKAPRRGKLGTCPKCSYSRTGLAADVVCPECGSLPSNEAPAAR